MRRSMRDRLLIQIGEGRGESMNTASQAVLPTRDGKSKPLHLGFFPLEAFDSSGFLVF